MARATRSSGRSSRNDRSIKVDFTDVGESLFRPPEDEYRVKIVKVNKTTSNNDNDQLEMDFEILEGKYTGKVFRNWFSLVPQALWKLAGVLRSAGVEIPEDELELDFDEIEGCELNVMIEHREFNDRIKAEIADSSEAEDSKPAKGKKAAKDEEEEKPARARRGRAAKEEEPEEKPTRTRRGRPAKDEEPEEKPRRGRKGKEKELEKMTADEVSDMDEDDLASLIEKYDLDVDLDDYKTLRKKAAATVDAMEEAGHIED